MSRLLIVSNRLPVTVEVERGHVTVTRSSGGLATGLSGPHERSGGLWLGWPGDVTALNADQRADVTKRLAELRTVPLYLTPSEVSRYYDGFANAVLWPLFHYLLNLLPLNARGWDAYRRVNQRFADLVVEHYRPGDLIWVHDYQLMLVPGMLRSKLPNAKIGFFLHIPFPAADVFRIFPWREELLQGVLGADLVGFHTFSYANHFASAVLRVLGVECTVDRLVFGGRDVRVGVFPMGIDAKEFSELAETTEVLGLTKTIREQHNGSILLGVDRLDYTKGIPRRLLAIERLLEREPSLRGKMQLMQVAVPSRVKVEAYAEFRRMVDEMVGRINGSSSTVSAPVIHYLYRSFSDRHLSALYRSADVMVVTPLRDGMNLVAKEFVASRNDEDGVLVLSEFAGAASELGEALHVNPYDIDGVAQTLLAALQMPPEERRSRMRALRKRVFAGDVHHWARAFIDTLEATTPGDKKVFQALTSEPDLSRIVETARAAERLILLLDYDGTLVPFARAPDLAGPDGKLIELLQMLARRPHTQVHVVSGRSPETLERWLGKLPIALHAEHGFWSRDKKGSAFVAMREVPDEWKDRVRPILEEYARRTPGSLLEEKAASLAWHYRMSDAEFGLLQARELRSHLTSALANAPLSVLSGDRVLEVRLQGVNKGLVASRILGHHNDRSLLLAMGDDTTDEDMFAALPPGAIAIHVGPSPSRAEYRVADPKAARDLLSALLA
jgi:trehalose 6-phosphate synthase/phosphatase